jgi:hypothetical protein
VYTDNENRTFPDGTLLAFHMNLQMNFGKHLPCLARPNNPALQRKVLGARRLVGINDDVCLESESRENTAIRNDPDYSDRIGIALYRATGVRAVG